MKTYFQLILELTEAATATKRKKPFDSVAFDAMQKAKYGAMMAKAAADALAAARKRKAAQPTRKPFPWMSRGSMVPGWWHPTKQWFSFGLNSDGYHITHLVKNIGKFGISETELLKAAQKEADNNSFYNEKSRKEQGLPPVDGREIIRMILSQDIDNAHYITLLAYKRGWLRVYGGKFHTGNLGGTLEGSDKNSMKAAIREIEQAAAMDNVEDFRIDVTERGNDINFWGNKVLDTKEKREAFLRS